MKGRHCSEGRIWTIGTWGTWLPMHARMQELEQRHEQQTMQLQQRHDMESQRFQTRLPAANPSQPRPPSRPR